MQSVRQLIEIPNVETARAYNLLIIDEDFMSHLAGMIHQAPHLPSTGILENFVEEYVFDQGITKNPSEVDFGLLTRDLIDDLI